MLAKGLPEDPMVFTTGHEQTVGKGSPRRPRLAQQGDAFRIWRVATNSDETRARAHPVRQSALAYFEDLTVKQRPARMYFKSILKYRAAPLQTRTSI